MQRGLKQWGGGPFVEMSKGNTNLLSGLVQIEKFPISPVDTKVEPQI